jgi:Na+/phosphate symporter
MSMHKSVQAAVALAMAAHNQQLAKIQTVMVQKDKVIAKITKKLEDLEVRLSKKKLQHSDSSA